LSIKALKQILYSFKLIEPKCGFDGHVDAIEKLSCR